MPNPVESTGPPASVVRQLIWIKLLSGHQRTVTSIRPSPSPLSSAKPLINQPPKLHLAGVCLALNCAWRTYPAKSSSRRLRGWTAKPTPLTHLVRSPPEPQQTFQLYPLSSSTPNQLSHSDTNLHSLPILHLALVLLALTSTWRTCQPGAATRG